MLTTAQAARMPRKKVMTMDTLAVFIDMKIGDQSIRFSPYCPGAKP